MQNTEYEDIIGHIRNRLSGVPGLAAAYCFGSMAEQSMKQRSDVDIALLFEHDGHKNVDRLSLMAELSGSAGRDADVIILNDAGPLLYHEVLRKGRVIFEANREYRIKREVLNRKLYEDYLSIHAIYMRGMKRRHGG